MSQNTQDLRATAYVFGELSPEEVVKFEQELESSAQLRDEVAGIQEAVAAVQSEFAAQTQGVSEADRVRIESAMASHTSVSAAAVDPAAGGRQWFVRLAIAASVLLLVGLAIPAFTPWGQQRDVTQRLGDTNRDRGVVTNDSRNFDRLSEEEIEIRELDVEGEEVGERLNTDAIVVSGRVRDRGEAETSKLDLYRRDSSTQAGSTSKESKSALRRELDEQSAGGAIVDEPMSEAAPSRSYRGRALGDKRDFKGAQETNGPVSLEFGESNQKDRSQALGIAFSPDGAAVTSPQPEMPGAQASAEHYGLHAPRFAAPAPPSGGDGAAPMDHAPVYTAPVKAESLAKGLSYQQRGTAASSPAGAPVAVDHLKLSLDSKAGSKQLGRAVEKQLEVGLSVSGEAKPNTTLEDQPRDAGRGGDRFDPIADNPFMAVAQAPLSTFSIDVDTASYSKVRMYLMQHNMLPQPDAVRIEELLNYFTYDYEPPQDEHPFAAHVAVAQCPWNPQHRLARVALKGKVIDEERPASNLVFLLDVSGSMNQPNKLPLVVEGMKMLTKQLGENDSVAIVVYAGAAGLVLDSTCGDDKELIIDALDRLRAGGSTAGAQGIQLAYEVARDHFIAGGTNRVILCTDGDFNVGVTDTDQLVKIAEQNAQGDIFLSVLGFGTGNHNDAMMEKVSNQGNGNYAFIDSEKEAQKVLVEQMGGTLVTIAKDVKIQVEFNPQEVASYRLIGYENRMLAAEDFNDDKKDAGEIGAGHTVTALYELVPADGDAELTAPAIDELRYQKKAKLTKPAKDGEFFILKLRYKQPTGTTSTLMEVPVKDAGKPFSQMDDDFKFAGTVAAFGMMLRNSPHKGNLTFAAVEEMAGDGIGQDQHGRRAEFIEIVSRAKELSGEK